MLQVLYGPTTENNLSTLIKLVCPQDWIYIYGSKKYLPLNICIRHNKSIAGCHHGFYVSDFP